MSIMKKKKNYFVKFWATLQFTILTFRESIQQLFNKTFVKIFFLNVCMLQWQCHEIFDNVLLLLIRFYLGLIWTGKNGFANFFVFAKIFAKNECQSVRVTLCQRSQRLRGQCVSIVNGYADMCQHSQGLCGHEIILLWKK